MGARWHAGRRRPVGYWRLFADAMVALLYACMAWTSLPRSFSIGGGWWMCIDYLGDGTLYSDQPFCSQPPVSYYLGYALRALFGDSLLIYAFWALLLAANLSNIILLRRILSRHALYSPRLFHVLYALMVFRFVSDIPSTLATSFLMAGFYLLYYTGGRFKGVSAGVALSLAIYTKYTVSLPALILVLYHPVAMSLTARMTPGAWFRMEPRLDRQALLDAIWAAVVVLAVFDALSLSYPLFVNYTVAAQAGLMESDPLTALSAQIRGMNANFAATFSMLAALAYSVLAGFYGRGTLIYPLMQSVVVIYGLIFLMAFGVTQAGSYYFLPTYPFLLVSYLAVREKSRVLFAFLVLVTIVFPSTYGSPVFEVTRSGYDRERASALDAIEYGLHYIPPQDGRVLVEGYGGFVERFRDLGAKVTTDQVDVIGAGQSGYLVHADPSWTPNLRREVGVSAIKSSTNLSLSPKELELQDEIASGKYSLIVYGPPSWEVTRRVLLNLSAYVHGSYCRVYVPNYLYLGKGLTYTTLFFRDRRDCQEMRLNVRDYYAANFNRICDLSYRASETVKDVERRNNHLIQSSCGTYSEVDFAQKRRDGLEPMDFLLTLLLSAPTYIALELIGRLEKG